MRSVLTGLGILTIAAALTFGVAPRADPQSMVEYGAATAIGKVGALGVSEATS